MLPSIINIITILSERSDALLHDEVVSPVSNTKQMLIPSGVPLDISLKSKSEHLRPNENKEEVKNRSYSFSKIFKSPSSVGICSEEEKNNIAEVYSSTIDQGVAVYDPHPLAKSEKSSTQYEDAYLVEENEIIYSNLYCKNVCPYISKIVRKSSNISSNGESEEPIDTMNSFWGDSSDNVIPKYYLTNVKEGKLLFIDFFFTIKDSILNLRRLTLYQLEYMKNRASDEEKYEIICLYDKICNNYYDTMLKSDPPSRA
jgi:hypothetical protein